MGPLFDVLIRATGSSGTRGGLIAGFDGMIGPVSEDGSDGAQTIVFLHTECIAAWSGYPSPYID